MANTVNNIGTARIYGDRLSISANTLNNQEETLDGTTIAATIAAREQLDIGAQNILNREHALIFSAGDMAIGGALNVQRQATGNALNLQNASATIEALGSLLLNVQNIRNSNSHLTVELQVQPNPELITEYQGEGAAVRYKAGTEGVFIYNDESDHLQTPDGQYERWTRYEYTREISKSVVTSTDPGKIYSGKSLTLNGTNIVNENSQIVAGGLLNITGGSVQNVSAEGKQIFKDSGTATSYWRNFKRAETIRAAAKLLTNQQTPFQRSA